MKIEKRAVRVVVAGIHFDPIAGFLEEAMPGEVRVEMVPRDHLQERLPDADVIIPTMTRIDEDLLAAAPKVRLIQQWGAGLEGVDIEAASRRQVAVANVPTGGTGNAESVAEWCVMAAITLSRHYPRIQEQVIMGGPWGTPEGRALFGKVAGIVGLGGIGRALAQRLKPFGMHLVAVKRKSDDTVAAELGLDWVAPVAELERLLKIAHYLFVCLPLTPETQGMLGARELSLLPPGSIVVNGSRGGIIERAAVEAALESGHLGGLALDVFWEEPPAPGDPLFQRPNVLTTPHIAGVTDVSYRGIASRVAENIRRVMAGYLPLNCVNATAVGSRLAESPPH